MFKVNICLTFPTCVRFELLKPIKARQHHCEPFADLPIERTSYNTIYLCIIHYILSIIHYILYITLRFTVLFGISCSSLMLHYLSSLCVKAALINIKININLNMTINININMKINININMKINININMKININISTRR